MINHIEKDVTGVGLHALRFLEGGGEMGAHLRACQWSATALGSPAAWPQALRTAVRLILNTGHPMYIFWGPDGLCFYNDAYAKSIGPERHPGSIGRPAREVWAEIWDIVGPQIAQVMAGAGATLHVNRLVPITRHGGLEDVYWTYSYSPIDDETAANGVGGVLVVCSETTKQVQAARQLELERDTLVQLFEQSPIVMALLQGPGHRIVLANPGYRRLVGNRDVIGRTVVETLPDGAAQGDLALLDEVFQTGRPYAATAATCLVQGEPAEPAVERMVDFVYQPLIHRDGHVVGIIVQGADVTERAHAQAAFQQAAAALGESEARFRDLANQLTAANRLKDDFLATLSHELRTPLNAVLGYTRLLRREPATPETAARGMEVIERNAVALQRIIEDVLDLSRIMSGQFRMNVEPVHLEGLIADSIASVSPAAAAKGVRLTSAMDTLDTPVNGDSVRLRQVVWNLLSNAIKFTPRDGFVEVQLTRTDEHVDIIVTDSGCGIVPAFLPFVFDRFRQADASTTREYAGLGLGLAIVKHLVELHGGTVDAASPGLDQGATFTVRLPRILPPSSEGQQAARDTHAVVAVVAAGARLDGMSVLAVDDEQDSLSLLREALEAAGATVETATSAAAALRALLRRPPDVLVSDLAMPHMDGLSLIRAVRQLKAPAGDVPAVALTALARAQDRASSLAAGYQVHLSKPVDPAQLVAAVAAMRGVVAREGAPRRPRSCGASDAPA